MHKVEGFGLFVCAVTGHSANEVLVEEVWELVFVVLRVGDPRRGALAKIGQRARLRRLAPDRADARDREPDQHRDNGNRDQKLDQGEGTGCAGGDERLRFFSVRRMSHVPRDNETSMADDTHAEDLKISI